MDIQDQNIPSGSENIVDMDEENLAFSRSSDTDAAFDTVMGCIEDIIIDYKFEQLQERFMEKHYLEFEDSDENKLSYTILFNEYVDLLEKYLEQQLMARIPSFNMDTFIAQLMQHKDEIPEDIFDMLLTFIDFNAFKMMFLSYRAEKEGRGPDLSQILMVTTLNSTGSSETY